MNYILVATGGAIGSLIRYWISAITSNLSDPSRFPLGTFLVNLSGCLLIGLVAGILEKQNIYNSELRLFLITGFLGGFTTFSAFSIETFYLFREGHITTALSYSLLSVLLGVGMVYLGLRISSS